MFWRQLSERRLLGVGPSTVCRQIQETLYLCRPSQTRPPLPFTHTHTHIRTPVFILSLISSPFQLFPWNLPCISVWDLVLFFLSGYFLLKLTEIASWSSLSKQRTEVTMDQNVKKIINEHLEKITSRRFKWSRSMWICITFSSLPKLSPLDATHTEPAVDEIDPLRWTVDNLCFSFCVEEKKGSRLLVFLYVKELVIT